MEAKFSPRVKDVLSFSREEALRLGNDFIGVEHFLLGILREGEGNAVRILSGFNLDLQKLKAELEKMGYKVMNRGQIGRTEVIKLEWTGKKLKSIEAIADKRGDDHATAY